VIAVLALPAVAPAGASAVHHFMKVNEVMLSQGGNPNAQFVELVDSMNESFTGGPYGLVAFDAAGTRLGGQSLTIAGSRNDTIPFLIATAATGLSGVEAPLTVQLPTAGGQVCFTADSENERVHCVGWCATSPVSTTNGFQSGMAPGDGLSLQRVGTALAVGTPTPDAANAASGAGSCDAGGGPGGGGPGGGGPGGMFPDLKAPAARLTAKKRQDVDNVRLAFTVDEAATVTVGGTVSVPNAAKTYRFKAVRRQAAAGTRVAVRLKLGRKARAAAKRAIKAKRRVTARIAISARDAAGNRDTAARRVRLSD
jgi:hypothetical protein